MNVFLPASTRTRTETTTTTRTGITPSITRNNLGPLTTVFTPPSGCDACFVSAFDAGRACAAYSTDCHGPIPSCAPGNASISLGAFYSPGLLCPAGWTTAEVISGNMTDNAKATELFGGIAYDETAAFCCPTGFTFTNGIFIPSTESTGGPQCASTMMEGEFVFNQCDVAKNSQRRTVRVGTSTYTTQLAWTSIREETFQFGPTTTVMWTSRTWTFFLVSTITTTAQRDAVTVAPAIQLVWRPGDLSLAQQSGPAVTSSDSNSSPASSQEPPLGKGAIAGIAVGAVVVAAMAILGIFMYIRRRRRKPSDVLDAPLETTESPSAAAAAVAGRGGLEPGQKAELDATSAAIKLNGVSMEKQELPADSVVPLPPAEPEPQRFELDATPVMRELPTTEEAMPPRDQTPPPVPAAHNSTPNVPVSPVSDRSSRQAGLSVNSPPSVLSSAGGNDRYTAEGWRASILEE